MMFCLLVLVLIVAITLFQANQGLFSAVIMTVLTICCAGAAIGMYEWVAVKWVAPLGWQPSYAPPITLVLLFVLPLGLFRLAFDKLITRACFLPTWLDRAGAGLCGVVTSLTVAGVLVAALQMLPFHRGSILGFQRVATQERKKVEDGPDPKPPDINAVDREVWLKPDHFAFSLASHLSGGLFSEKHTFGVVNPDPVAALGWHNAAPAIAARYAPPNSIEIVKAEPVQVVYRRDPPRKKDESPVYEPLEPGSGKKFWMVRVRLKKEARLEARSHVFSLMQFQVVGSQGADELKRYHAIGIQQPEDDSPNRHFKLEKNGRYGDWPVTDRAYEPRMGNNGEVEVVFEVPKAFSPVYIEYKRSARAALKFDDSGSTAGSGEQTGANAAPAPGTGGQAGARTAAAKADDNSGSASSPRGSRGRRRSRGGNVRGVTTSGTGSFFGDRLPQTLSAYTQRSSGDVTRGALVDGHLVADLDKQSGGSQSKVSKLSVPSDKRLLHLNTDKLDARSGIGKILSQTVQTVQNFFVEDDKGNRYKVVGKYAEADVDGRRMFEVQYFSNPTGSVGGMGKFYQIKDRHLKDDYRLVYLFLVDPGAKIVNFSTGGSASRKDDLSLEDLVAPK